MNKFWIPCLYLAFLCLSCNESILWEYDNPEGIFIETPPCAPVCTNRVLITCDADGREIRTPCEGDTPYCGYDNGNPICVPPGCHYNEVILNPGETTCDGNVKVMCMLENHSNHENCAELGQVCRAGECVDCEDGTKPLCFERPDVNHLIACTCDGPKG